MSLMPETGTVKETATTAARTRGVIAHLIWFWLPVAVWMAAIFHGSSRTSLPGPLSWPSTEGFILRKATHMVEYAGLFVLLQRALIAPGPMGSQATARLRRDRTRSSPGWVFVQTLMGCLLFALSDELHQSFVPGRDAVLVDVGWDMLGATVGLAVVVLVPALRASLVRGAGRLNGHTERSS